MYRILIVDDEKLERNGIKFLLKKTGIELEVFEASNGRDALELLTHQKAEILLTDIKMPYMNGLDLAEKVSLQYPEMKIIMFSGYSDFSYAQTAIRYGVSDYILKPVDPSEFQKTIKKTLDEIRKEKEEEVRQIKKQDYFVQFLLQNYLYGGKADFEEMKEILDFQQYHYMVLIQTSSSFFEIEEEIFKEKLKEEIHRDFFYLNLNAGEGLFFFREKHSNYELLCREIYQFFKLHYNTECLLAVSEELKSFEELPIVFGELEKVLEDQFYQPEKHIFSLKDDEEGEKKEFLGDSELLKRILEDINHRDMVHLKNHFEQLKVVYHPEKAYSEMYIKFLFSNIIKEIYEVMDLPDEKKLSKEIDKLYRVRRLQDVWKITEKAMEALKEYLAEEEKGTRSEVMQVKNYIYQNYQEELSVDILAEKVYLSPGYLSYIFKQETGMNLNRFIKAFRMDKAKNLLENTQKKISQIAKEVGFSNNSYFCRSFREYFGVTPESCRKGTAEYEKMDSEI